MRCNTSPYRYFFVFGIWVFWIFDMNEYKFNLMVSIGIRGEKSMAF